MPQSVVKKKYASRYKAREIDFFYTVDYWRAAFFQFLTLNVF